MLETSLCSWGKPESRQPDQLNALGPLASSLRKTASLVIVRMGLALYASHYFKQLERDQEEAGALNWPKHYKTVLGERTVDQRSLKSTLTY